MNVYILFLVLSLVEEHPGEEPSEELQVQWGEEQERSKRKVVAAAAGVKTVQRLFRRKVFLPIKDPNRKHMN